MKVRIIQEGNKEKRCIKCGHNIFRKSTKTVYNKEHTEGFTYELEICDKCNNKEKFNLIHFHIEVRI